MTSEYRPGVKSIASVRRKAGMTKQEFYDHRYQIHGSITDAPPDSRDKPAKYIQDEIYDSAYGQRPDGPPNSLPNYFGIDDVAELYFDDIDHLLHIFSTPFVREVIGPDGAKFADFESAMSVLVKEKSVPLEDGGRPRDEADHNLVAMYWISTKNQDIAGEAVEAKATPVLVDALAKHASSEVSGLIANVGFSTDAFDPIKYFGGSGNPRFALIYKIVMKGPSSARAVRAAQHAFEEQLKETVDLGRSFILFGKEALVMDQSRSMEYDPARQPVWPDLGQPVKQGRYDWETKSIVGE